MCTASRDSSNSKECRGDENLPTAPLPAGPSQATAAGTTLARLEPAEEPWLTEGGARLRAGELVAFPTGNHAMADIVEAFSLSPDCKTAASSSRQGQLDNSMCTSHEILLTEATRLALSVSNSPCCLRNGLRAWRKCSF